MRNTLYYYKETDGSVSVCVVLLSGMLQKNLPVKIVSTDITAFGILLILIKLYGSVDFTKS